MCHQKYKTSGQSKRQSFGMISNLSCQQLRTGYYLHRISQVNLTVTTREKLTENIQKKIKQESKHDTEKKKIHTITRKERRKEERLGTIKTAREQLTKWQ